MNVPGQHTAGTLVGLDKQAFNAAVDALLHEIALRSPLPDHFGSAVKQRTPQPEEAKLFSKQWVERQYALNAVAACNCKTSSSKLAFDTAPVDHVNAMSHHDNSDRMFLSSEFAYLQAKIGHEFTLDACCNASGKNALCPKFCSSASSFLAEHVAGEHVWLCPPPQQTAAFVQHYLDCKKDAPASTSACIVLPKWQAQKLSDMLQDMQLIHEYAKGTVLFAYPAGTSRGHKRLPGTQWPVQVYYDAPAGHALLSLTSTSHTMQFKAQLGGKSCTAAVCKEWLSCSALVDSGATGIAYVSKAFCRREGLSYKPCAKEIKLADGRVGKALGECKVHVKIGSYKAVLNAMVIDMFESFDLILGDDWLVQNKAYLDFGSKRCVLKHGRKRHELQPAKVERSESCTSSASSDQILSAEKFSKLIRKGASLMVVRVVKDEPDAHDSEPMPTAHAQHIGAIANMQHADDCALGDVTFGDGICNNDKLRRLAHEFADRWPKDRPPYKHKAVDVPEAIPLEPGTGYIARPMYRYSPLELAEMEKQVNELLEMGYIEESNSPFAAPVLFAKKKDGTLRMCLDLRALNAKTIKLKYPLPNINTLFDSLQGNKCWSVIDCLNGYNNLPLHPNDRPKTSFRTPFGQYSWKTLCFGLTNAPAVWMQYMHRLFKPMLYKKVLIYLDDILVLGKTPEEHEQNLREVLQVLRDNDLYAKASKTMLNMKSINFLGHIVSGDGISADPKKTQVIHDWPDCKNVKQVRQFVGLATYFRRYIQGFSKMVAPLTALLKDGVPFNFGAECKAAMTAVRQALTSPPVLAYPDFEKPFELIADASGVGLGAVLMQDGRPVAFESRKMTETEQRYPTTEQELLAVVHAFEVWRCYLESIRPMKHTVITDHNPNTFFQTKAVLSRRQARWAETLGQYHFEWQYRPGRINVADPLSRHPDFTIGLINSIADAGSVDTPFVADCKAGYAQDPWFAEEANTAKFGLEKIGDLWYKGEALVVPNTGNLRHQCLHECHDAPYSGHFGVTKTMLTLKRSFWWPSMRADVQQYVSSCDSCQRVKSRNDLPAGLLHPLPVPPDRWKSVSLDFVVELPPCNGYDAILVFVDRLTKMVHLAPTTSTCTAVEAAKLFRDNVFRLHGFPTQVVSDRGPQFVSHFWTELMKLLDADIAMTSAHRAQSDGQTERVNRVMEDTLRHVITPTGDNWPDQLSMVEFAINNSYHESVRATPFQLNYGMHPHTPASVARSRKVATDTCLSQCKVPAAREFTQAMSELVAKAKLCMESAQKRQKSFYDPHHKHVSYKVGDMVMLCTANLKIKSVLPKKLLPRFVGPFRIIKEINEVAFQLELPDNMKCHNVFHVSLLKPYIADARHSKPPPPDVVDGALEYEVDSILNHEVRSRGRNRKRVIYYLVTWKGHGAEHNTWEPENNLTNCSELLQEYWKTQTVTAGRAGTVPGPPADAPLKPKTKRRRKR